VLFVFYLTNVLGWYTIYLQSTVSLNRQITTFTRPSRGCQTTRPVVKKLSAPPQNDFQGSSGKKGTSSPSQLIRTLVYLLSIEIRPINLLQSRRRCRCCRHCPTSHCAAGRRQSILSHCHLRRPRSKPYAFQTQEKRRSCRHGCGWYYGNRPAKATEKREIYISMVSTQLHVEEWKSTDASVIGRETVVLLCVHIFSPIEPVKNKGRCCNQE
jgi:hypothetical protein